jgi:hypothetical protein
MTEDDKITELWSYVKAKCDEHGFDFFLFVKPSIDISHAVCNDEHKFLGADMHNDDCGIWWEVR